MMERVKKETKAIPLQSSVDLPRFNIERTESFPISVGISPDNLFAAEVIDKKEKQGQRHE